MASVRPYKYQFCARCRAVEPGRKKPAGDDCNCKVLAWRVFWRNPDGSKRSEVFDRTNGGKRAADAKKAEVEDGQRRGTYVDPHGARVLFIDYAEEWAAAQDWKESTADMWPTRRKLLAEYVGKSTTLGSIDKLALLAIRKRLADKYARSYVATAMHTIKAILRMAVASGKIPRDPTVDVDATPKRRADDKTGRVTPEMVPTASEAWAILAAAPSEYRAAHALGLAGLRIGEVLGMQVDRIDLDAGTVTVDVQATELRGQGVILATPKAEKTRTIEVPAAVLTELRRHLAQGYGGVWVDPRDGTDHCMLFLRNGKLLSLGVFYPHGWTPALKKAGYEGRFTFHGYRHLCASQLLSEGVTNAIVAGHLGHHIHTLNRVYAHWLRDDKSVPARILDSVYARAVRDASRMPHAA